MIDVRERVHEKAFKLRHTVFGLDDETFNSSMPMVPPIKRSAVKAVRSFVDGVVEEQELQYLGLGVECVAFLRPKDKKVKKYFWPGNPTVKYDRLCRETEIIRGLIGDIALDTETSRETFSIFKLGKLTVPVQVQELAPIGALPENPQEAGEVTLADLETLLIASQGLRNQSNPWLDISPANFGVAERIGFFDLSLFDPANRGKQDTVTSLSLHSEYERYLATAKTHA